MKNFFTDNPFVMVAALVALFIAGWLGGCQVTARSLMDPSLRVTRIELENELETILNTAQARFEQIDREETLRRELLNHALLIGQAGSVNLVGLIPIAASILGAGAVADNVRKRKIIKTNTREYVKTVKENSGTAGDSA